jgi:transcriptional regulator with XRE-family HTH domain
MKPAQDSSQPGAVTARVAATVLDLRKRTGLTAQVVADRTVTLHTKVSRSTMAKLETGRLHALTVEQLDAIATALGVPAVDLLTGNAVAAALRQRSAELRAEADRIEREAGL